MILRSRLIITAFLACHLFLIPQVLTSQLRSDSGSASERSEPNALPQSPARERNPAAESGTPGVEIVPQTAGTDSNASTASADLQETQKALSEQIAEPTPEQEENAGRPAMNVPLGRDEVLIFADHQKKDQDIYTVSGHVVIRFRDSILHCDEATYDSTTGVVNANGHVVFDGGKHDEHVTGTHGTYDVSRETGTFYDASGSTGMRIKNKQMFLTSSTPFFFQGKVVEKLGPDRYRVHHGFITSCQLPKPKWRFVAQSATVEVGEDARMHNATLRIGNIPVFYFPYAQHPIDNLGRKSGFLIPVVGVSNTRGTIIGDGFYWAINRSSDATIGAELYSKRGWAQHGLYRAVGYTYFIQASYYGVVDSKGQPETGQNQGGEEARFNTAALLPHGFRAVASVDYLSSFLFRQAFGQSFNEAITSEVHSFGFISRSRDGNFGAILAGRYQNYQSSTQGDVIDIAHVPSLQFAGLERPLFGSRFMYAYDVAGEGLSRHEPGFQTASLVGRGDVHPSISMPNFLHGWTIRPELGADETVYSQRLLAASATNTLPRAIDETINRNVLHTSLEVRPPTLAKVFERKPFGYVFKHTVEPYTVYRYQTGISNFSEIIRFDYRDILSDTNEIEYGVVNRLFAKKSKSSGKCFLNPHYPQGSSNFSDPAWAQRAEQQGYCDDTNGAAKEVLSWELAQKYYFDPTFGGAVVNGARNVFDTSANFTGIAYIYGPRRFSPLISRLRFQNNNSDLEWALDYDSVLQQLNASTISGGYRWKDWYVNGGQTYMNIPASLAAGGTVIPANTFNQFRFLLQYGNINRRGINAGGTVGYDYEAKATQYVGIQANYNWDCCGVTFEYRHWGLGAVRTENYYRFALSLANFGTFGNIRRQDRVY
jgi:LPS-assembly protein